MQLLSPVTFGRRIAPNRVVFGPHVTNLAADDRSIPDRHVAYYERRARGGCGTIVVEGASVHPSDWPYERCAARRALRRRAGPRSSRHADRTDRWCSRRSTTPAGQGSSRLQPGAAVGAVAGARGELPRGAEVDGSRRHRGGRRRLRRGDQARRGGRSRRCRDQRRPAQPRAPVPVRDSRTSATTPGVRIGCCSHDR